MSFHLLQLADQDKLSLVGKPIFKVIGSLVVATIFWGMQELAEIGFQCPWIDVYNEVYGISFLAVPAVVLTLLSVFLHRECLMCCRCQRMDGAKCTDDPTSPDRHRHRSGSWKLIAFLKIFYHGWMWIIVVLLDGDCYACIHYFLRLPSSQGVMGNSENIQCETKIRNRPNDESELMRVLKFESRVIGLGLLLTLVVIAVCISCCHVSRCCGKPYYWWEYQQMYLEETEKIVLNNLKDSASRRAENNYKNKTSAGAEEAWECISSAGFAKIEYPEDFRVVPRANNESAQNDRLPIDDGGRPVSEAPLKDASEATDRDSARSEREEEGMDSTLGQGEATEPTDDAQGPHCQAGQAGVTPPEQEESGKLGWKTRLREHLQGIRRSLRRTVGSALRKPHPPKNKIKGAG